MNKFKIHLNHDGSPACNMACSIWHEKVEMKMHKDKKKVTCGNCKNTRYFKNKK